MSHLVSNSAKNAESLPRNYVFPPGDRPGDVEVPICSDIPVIDLSQENGQSKCDLLQQIMKACQDYGLFQVINHGVSDKVMDDTMSVCHEFFELPSEDKAKVYSEDVTKGCKLHSGKSDQFWRDFLQHQCHPVEDHIESWPEKPPTYREVIGAYSANVRDLGLKILDLICEGLGIELGYFGDELSKVQTLVINHYPPCPDPNTIGLWGHCDPNLMTILQQETYGLQILKDDNWIGIKPLPHAFVIIISVQLEVISNGKLKSACHRAVTNAEAARTSLANFISPSSECIIEPAKGLANGPPIFKTFKSKDFFETYKATVKELLTGGDNSLMAPLEPFKL